MPEVPISGREHVLGLACGAVASGGYCHHCAGDGDPALDVFKSRPTAIGTPQRMQEVPISGREHVLGLACNTVASGGYYRHRAGDGEHALDVSQRLPTAIGTPYRMPEVPISGREHVLGLARGAVASGGYCRHRAGDGDLALDVFQTRPTAIGTPHRIPDVPISSREEVLGLACNTVASGGYYPHRAGDGYHALDVSQMLPTALHEPHPISEVPISGREHVLGLARGAVASGRYYRHRAGDGDLALDVFQTRPTA